MNGPDELAREHLIAFVYECAMEHGCWSEFLSKLCAYFPHSFCAFVVEEGIGGVRTAILPAGATNGGEDPAKIFSRHMDPVSAKILSVPVGSSLPALRVGATVAPNISEALLGDRRKAALQQADRGGRVSLLVTRPYGPVPAAEESFLRALAPHFAAAGRLGERATRMRLHSHALEDVVERLPVGAMILDAEGRVVVANRVAASLLKGRTDIYVDAVGRCRLRRREHDAELQEAVAQMSKGTDVRRRLITVARQEDRTISLLMTPLASGNGGANATVAFIADTAHRAPPKLDALRELYNLSPGEVRVVQGIIQGARLEDIATETKVSVHTIRNQLKTIFLKTGVNRQADLVNLVMGGPAALSGARS